MNQARRYRDRRIEGKRLPIHEKVLTAPRIHVPRRAPRIHAADPEDHPLSKPKARTSIAIHSFPNRATVVEPHIVKSADAISLKPMTIEEAIKDTELRDRDLLIFRNPSGVMFVLHRRRDGEMELVEIS